MLESDYLAQYTALIHGLDWEIVLPREWADFFDQRGHAPSCQGDQRASQRLRLRTYGAMFIDDPLPAFPRPTHPIGVYMSDFSRQGCGFLNSFALLPEEQIRIVLPTFWVRLCVVRARRITKHCFEIGTVLKSRMDPSEEAFRNVADLSQPSAT